MTATITSPPYGHLKDYGGAKQIGWAQSYDDYLADCERIFADLFEVTMPNGTLWLVVDTLRREGGSRSWKMEPLPFQLADRAAESGWILRDVIIWRKDRTLPWSGDGRLRNAFEYVLQLVKTDDFKYEKSRLRTSTTLSEWWVRFPERYHPLGTTPTNVWDIPIPRQGSWAADTPRHSCPLPAELVDRLILLSTDPGDVVLDPFAGTGIVLARARELQRRGIGFDLQAEYARSFEKNWPASPEGRSSALEAANQPDTTLSIRRLRALKLPRVMVEGIRKSADYTGPLPIAALVLANPRPDDDLSDPRRYVEARILFVAKRLGDRKKLSAALTTALARRPASKFGVDASLDVVGLDEVEDASGRKQLYVYENGKFWHTTGRQGIRAAIRDHASDKRMVILSNMTVALNDAVVDV